MKFLNNFMIAAVVLAGISLSGCAKEADPKRPIEKIQKEVMTMSVAQLEAKASSYAAAIRAQKAEIAKIQQQIQKMPIEKVFNDKSMTRRIAGIGQEAEALFERYRIYVKAYQEKGGDIAKVQLEPPQEAGK
jgi:outer membrane murein-binding lipoprotein Lpp